MMRYVISAELGAFSIIAVNPFPKNTHKKLLRAFIGTLKLPFLWMHRIHAKALYLA